MENENQETMEMTEEEAQAFVESILYGGDSDFERQFVDYVEDDNFEDGYSMGMKYSGFFTALVSTGMTPHEAFELTHEVVIADINKEVLRYGEKFNMVKEIESGA